MEPSEEMKPGELSLSGSVVVAGRAPEELYEMVADVTRMGEWSPVCTGGSWLDGNGPQVGARFVGRNQTPERTWETTCTVVAAEPGRELAWVVNAGWVRWGYSFEPVEGGTRVTESWEVLPAGVEGFAERFGADADAQLANRKEAARSGIPTTLQALKAAAETGSAGRGAGSPGRAG
ncbi:MAG: SRPBCC family protein [Actinomycetota bacterium]|nr:SRPBCC family protein [Actinomycetota bacterium]